MRAIPGSPGTLTSLFLRIMQCVFAAGSIASMSTTSNFFNFTAFWYDSSGAMLLCFCFLISILCCEVEDHVSYLIASMGLQVVWSFALAILDGIALVKKVLHNPVLVSLYVTALLSLAAASSSGGIAVLYFNDLGSCGLGEECQKYQLAVALAFLGWVAVSISFLIMLWLFAAG
ncbi:hypothetical protein Gotri_028109 [Gossypium trilobum]|uniref:CASP-like protein n=1 Tax=Gossypium trilobum TaxID=34281 RepID=A0A7J9FM32_9ROSI|nr:hypothetical protein [Gossypium trilobum]